MNSRFSFWILAVALCAPLGAQPLGRQGDLPFRQEVRLLSMLFGNFYQATVPALEEDVRGVGVEYRAAYRAWKDTDVYGHLNVLDFDEQGKKTSYGGRAGVTHDGERHDYNIYVDHGENRSTFDIAGVTDTGAVTTLTGEYAFRMTEDWQLGAEAEYEQQRFGHTHERENDATSVGANVRYRGFGYKFMPEVGYVTGSRDVVDETESYDDSYWYVQLVSSPNRRIYLSLSYRDRLRDYTTRDITSSKFGAEETRGQWTGSASYRATDRVAYILYYSQEDTASSRPGRDFDTDFLLLAVSVGF
ncbi:MAG: hypothetical protein ACJ74H_22390 [Thermoanaerobaculia bacterium]